MLKPVLVIGQGEMGGVFSRSLLKAGHTVVPILRGTNLEQAAQIYPTPEFIVVAVGEKDLQNTLKVIPTNWRDGLILLQNELLPHDWQKHQLTPTVISVWFEKKKGQDFKVIIPSPIFGPNSNVIASALDTLGIPCLPLADNDQLVYELILKNVYIVTTNVTGLQVGGTVGELWAQHQSLARQVASDVIAIQAILTNTELDGDRLINGMVAAFEGDLDHKCMGRSAPARLNTALAQADKYGLAVKTLRSIAEQNT